MRRSNMLSHYKLVSLYVANNGRSQNFSNIYRLVSDIYDGAAWRDYMPKVYALFHAGRMCHQQGWIRDWASLYVKGLKEETHDEHTLKMCKQNCLDLLATFKPDTIACWDPVCRTSQSPFAPIREPWFTAMCEAYDKEKKKKNKQAKKDRLRAKEVKLARKLLRQGMH